MKKIYLCLIILAMTLSEGHAQLVSRHHFFQTDFSNFKTYRLAGFTINEKIADPEESSQVSVIQSKLHEALSKRGFEQAEEPDMLVFLLLEVDTLGVNAAPDATRELMASFNIDIRQNPGFEKIFKGNVNGLVVTDEKSESRLKKIYRKFFNNFDK